MNETAMRDADGTPVFVAPDGAYCETFPYGDIVRRAKDDNTVFDVYGFVGSNDDYVELRWTFEKESVAIMHATEIYGSDVETVTHEGEIFEVEVHERDLTTV